MALLSQLAIAVGGSHKGYPQVKLEKLITNNGGSFAKVIEPGVTHLVTTQADVEKQSTKVKSAQTAGLYLVSLNWLLESIEASKVLAEKDYIFDAAVAPVPASSGPSSSQASATTGPRAGTRVSKRTASNLKNMVIDSEEEKEKPAAKKTRGAAKGKAVEAKVEDKMDVDEEEEEEKPAPKKPKGRAAAKGKKAKEEEEKAKEEEEKAKEEEEKAKEEEEKAAVKNKKIKEEEEEKADAKPVAAKGKAKGKGKAVVKVIPKDDENEEEEEEEEEKKEEIKPKMKTITKKGKAPVDELCPNRDSLHVYVDGMGTVYDATLNQTDINANNNKFYYCQLLESDRAKAYFVWVHFGRVGERGQVKMYCSGVSFQEALPQFEKLFKSKTGCYWSNRADAHGGPKKYAFLERNYDEDEAQDEAEVKAEGSGATATVKSRLAKPLQNLMQLIFNVDIMQQSMASLSYDSNKLPLGKLSKEVISRGYQTLKDLGEVIEQRPGCIEKFSEYGDNRAQILNRLSNRYYTVIPHSFGRNTPPVIDTGPKLKKEIELIENLGDMALTTKIMSDTKAANADGIHQLDKQFDSLGLNEAVPLDKSTAEFKNLEAYVTKTQGETHYTKLTVEDIFRVTRSGEADRWQEDGWDKRSDDNRHLLWHGSRSTNFAGILSQGLRIAPPEAPVNGYMFGKGIYLADIVSKSANYCCASSSNNTGLLLLCEAQLGDPMFELHQSDYRAAENCKKQGALATKGLGRSVPLKWEDASIVHKNLKGVKMPAVTTKAANITGDDPAQKLGHSRSLQYNEYIVYNTSQVQIRYLFRCKFGH